MRGESDALLPGGSWLGSLPGGSWAGVNSLVGVGLAEWVPEGNGCAGSTALGFYMLGVGEGWRQKLLGLYMLIMCKRVLSRAGLTCCRGKVMGIPHSKHSWIEASAWPQLTEAISGVMYQTGVKSTLDQKRQKKKKSTIMILHTWVSLEITEFWLFSKYQNL